MCLSYPSHGTSTKRKAWKTKGHGGQARVWCTHQTSPGEGWEFIIPVPRKLGTEQEQPLGEGKRDGDAQTLSRRNERGVLTEEDWTGHHTRCQPHGPFKNRGKYSIHKPWPECWLLWKP